ncbi:hypothetical protein OG985_21795 [Streptomyces sp. NBC_00289]|uniref:hypothetical protein n=1 Tax=Streptomyces sp. NBC_00289 TaxID=2975703 RepID=UPI003245B598
MPLPAGVETVTVSAGEPLTLPDGTAMTGTLLFTGPDLVTIAGQDTIAGGTVEAPLVNGEFTKTLVATDATGMSPTAWTYRVEAVLSNAPGWVRYISLPKASPAVVLADVLVPDPVAGTYTTLVDPASVLAGVTVTGTASAGKVLTASSSSAASWQTPSSGGGAAQPRTARVRITNDDLSGLPEAASWAVVQTSAGTQLKCSIAASAGDRILVCPNFLYLGSHYLDWVLLDSGGSIAEYATSESSSPPSEGNPAMYPLTTLSRNSSSEMFTAGPAHIDGSGSVTIALAHQGLGTGSGNRVYAHPTYPWRLRLENIYAQPA